MRGGRVTEWYKGVRGREGVRGKAGCEGVKGERSIAVLVWECGWMGEKGSAECEGKM